MTDLEVVERKALVVLFFESKINPGRFFPVRQTLSEYHVFVDGNLADAAFEPWFKRGWAKSYRRGAVVCAKLAPRAYGDAYKQVLLYLGGTSLSVQPDLREVVSDARASNEVPLREGWKWYQYESDIIIQENFGLSKGEDLPTYLIEKFDWTKWGTIAAWISIPLALLGIAVAIWLDNN